MGKLMSVSTIGSPEFVNITSISPLVSKCEIKVLYVGENRNRSFITKEVAREMAQTLPGCPIVGYYIENKEDYGDHGEQVIIDAEGVKFNKLTKPYGFVAPNARIWFQTFDETDAFGNVTRREYLMSEGFLWTGQFEECQEVINSGKPQSMELDEKTLKGYWSTEKNRGVDFFIINDAIFSKLCILGDDVEPCFEGASITAPQVSATFSKNDDFTKTLYQMVNELKFALDNLNKGGLSMDNVITTPVVEQPVVEEPVIETPVVEEPAIETPVVENFSNEEGKDSEIPTEEIQDTVEEFTKKDDSEKEKEEKDEPANGEDDSKEKATDSDSKEKDDEEDKKKYELLQEQYTALQQEFDNLKIEFDKLVEFKNQVEDSEKDELIAQFYMLSDEDKQDVIENKSKYSLEDIESKLSVICVRKKVNFTVEDNNTQANANPVTYNLGSSTPENVPAWLKAVEAAKNRNK